MSAPAAALNPPCPFRVATQPPRQVLRVYVLARATPQALRMLPGMEAAAAAATKLAARDAAAAAATAAAATAAAPGEAGAKATGGQAGGDRSWGASATSAPAAAQPLGRTKSAASRGGAAAGGAAGSGPAEPAPIVLGPGDIPSDEALASSNVYSAAEATLLSWLNVNVARAFPERAQVRRAAVAGLARGRRVGCFLGHHSSILSFSLSRCLPSSPFRRRRPSPTLAPTCGTARRCWLC
jgi:hypothetical protein